jgi:hypothetical protein
MATFEDVAELASALPDTEEGVTHGNRAWKVHGKLFVWERPLRGSDLEALGAAAPTGPVLGARVEHLGAKEALLAAEPEALFTTPHFDGYPSVLARLEEVGDELLRELVVEAWLARAPKRAVQAYLEDEAEGPA